jgi:hypothetical protein
LISAYELPDDSRDKDYRLLMEAHIDRDFQLRAMNHDELTRLSAYAGALGAWAMVAQGLEQWIQPELLEDLRRMAPELKGNSLSYAEILVNKFMLDSDARLGARAENGQLSLTVAPASRLHRVTTSQWFKFTVAPYHVQKCRWCDMAYTPVRSTSMFCSSACRQAAHKAGKEPPRD